MLVFKNKLEFLLIQVDSYIEIMKLDFKGVKTRDTFRENRYLEK